MKPPIYSYERGFFIGTNIVFVCFIIYLLNWNQIIYMKKHLFEKKKKHCKKYILYTVIVSSLEYYL